MNVFYLQWKRNNMLIKARVELKGRGFYTQLSIKISMCSCIRKPDISPCLTLQNYQSAVRIVYWFVPCWGEFLTIIRRELSEEWIHELCKYSLLPFNDFILFFAFGRQQEYLIHFWMSYWVFCFLFLNFNRPKLTVIFRKKERSPEFVMQSPK